MATTKSKKFKYLIVPCPGNPIFDGEEVKFSDTERDRVEPDYKLYLGAGDRMQAAVLVARNAEKVVLVGGTQSRVTAMFVYFKKEMSKLRYVSRPEIINLVSRPDSTGNLSAFKKYFNANDRKSEAVAIISNKYHLPRLRLIWKTLFNDVKLKTIAAETLLKKGTMEKMYPEELRRRMIRETAGLRDWDNKQYKDQDKIENWNEKFWKCERIILEFEV